MTKKNCKFISVGYGVVNTYYYIKKCSLKLHRNLAIVTSLKQNQIKYLFIKIKFDFLHIQWGWWPRSDKRLISVINYIRRWCGEKFQWLMQRDGFWQMHWRILKTSILSYFLIGNQIITSDSEVSAIIQCTKIKLEANTSSDMTSAILS